MLKCKFCGDPFQYDKQGNFGAGTECTRNTKGTEVKRWHTQGWHEYWGHECCGAKDFSDPRYLGCETRTVQQYGPHEPVDLFWTSKLHCSIPSSLSAPAREFVLFTMFVGEAVDRSMGLCTKLPFQPTVLSEDVLEALPPEVWLHILSYLRLSELRFATPSSSKTKSKKARRKEKASSAVAAAGTAQPAGGSDDGGVWEDETKGGKKKKR
jgi:hypothetical protein